MSNESKSPIHSENTVLVLEGNSVEEKSKDNNKTTTDLENQHQKINSAKIVYSHNVLSAFKRGLFVEPHLVSLLFACIFLSSISALLWSISHGGGFIQLIV